MAGDNKITGLRKIAIFMITIGPEQSAKLLKNFSDEEIERISAEIANTSYVDVDNKKNVIEEFLQLNNAQNYIASGGVEYARDLLNKIVGSQKANEIIKRCTATLKSQIKPFAKIGKIEPEQLLSFLNKEHPQTIALILSYLNAEKAAVILNSLPEDMQSEIAQRIATMDRTSPEILKEVELVMESKLSSLVAQDFTATGGLEALVDILNRVDRGTEKSILEDLEEEDHELAEEIRKRMFVFEDIITLDNFSIQRVLREVDLNELAYAIKGSSDEVAQRIYRNISKRAAEMLRDDINSLGPVRLRDVEAAQQRIVQIIRNLDEAGEIIISRGGEDAIVV